MGACSGYARGHPFSSTPHAVQPITYMRLGGVFTPATWDECQTASLRIYTDGSCRLRISISAPRAGYSVVAVDEAGDIVAAEIRRVPLRLPQTAAASEAWAFHRAASFMGNCLAACTDNASVVSNARPEATPDPRHVLAGIYRSWLSASVKVRSRRASLKDIATSNNVLGTPRDGMMRWAIALPTAWPTSVQTWGIRART